MDTELRTRLRQRYHLETALLQQMRRREKTQEDIRQTKWELRSQKDNLLNYESGLRGLLDRFTGKKEEKSEAFQREIRHTEAALDSLLRLRESLVQDCEEISRELERLPDRESLRSAAEGNAEALREWAGLEARLCAEALLPLLEGNYEALLEYRSLLQGSRLEILSVQEQQRIYGEPDKWAEKCVPLLSRLKEALDVLESPLDPGGYFGDYRAFLVSAAARHNRLDRVNQALDQVAALRNRIRSLADN